MIICVLLVCKGCDKSLRKGCKVFLTLKDGKVQSAVYKGQKATGMGESEAILVSSILLKT